ncbi:MAG: hypothetical protein IPL74_00865 [Bacteroidetes bacterium]|nr:hypothetical protein [Bacteroidota bacterium]
MVVITGVVKVVPVPIGAPPVALAYQLMEAPVEADAARSTVPAPHVSPE